MELTDYLNDNGWNIVRDASTPALEPSYASYTDLNLSSTTRSVLSRFADGIYRHQRDALKVLLDGQNVCMTTSTSSGKSLVFYACAAELLQRSPNARILAIYPLKALTDEQEMKWREAMSQGGTSARIGRIDGSVPVGQRARILRESAVVVMTPDVVHAWLLSNLADRAVQKFIANLQLVVIDEAHTYTGVFGSNSAYLFRRLQHAANGLGGTPRYIAASATINDAARHLRQLTSMDFQVIGQDEDTSGRRARRLLMVELPSTRDEMTSLTDLMHFVVRETEHQFVTFVDSRKQTEQLASVMRRGLDSDGDDSLLEEDILERLQVCPFRAGYEAEDRRHIQDRLRLHTLRGVVSTSALEMGIDIPWLTLGILYGIPYSATSYFQRIGRIGRHADGTIIVVNNGSILSNRVFRNPISLDTMPLAEGALYLENPRIQYIHTMCLASSGGEHDAIPGSGGPDDDFMEYTHFPEPFLVLCKKERVGEIEPEFQAMKSQAGTSPHHIFPLRDCEVQYQVETLPRTGYFRRLGSLSFSQVMREAYPGGVYYYQTQTFRVVRIQNRERKIIVRDEKRYTTKPTALPTLIFPNLSDGNVYSRQRYGDLRLIECNLALREAIIGFKERRGPNEFQQLYPLDPNLGFFFDQPRFERNYFSSGVLFVHPMLDQDGVDRQMLAELLFEAFVIQVPFERQDLHHGSDRFRVTRGSFAEGQRFLCVYDQTYGSLRLTSRLMAAGVLRGVLEKAVDIAQNDDSFELSAPTMAALSKLHELSLGMSVSEAVIEESLVPPENCAPIILPGSLGLYPDYQNEEYRVDGVYYTPKGLMYRGSRLSKQGERWENVVMSVPVDKIMPVEGRSRCGYYDYETGEIQEGPDGNCNESDDGPDTVTKPF